jgi:hypothetical protein
MSVMGKVTEEVKKGKLVIVSSSENIGKITPKYEKDREKVVVVKVE